MVQAKYCFPVLRASRLRELMEESKLSQRMDQAELNQVPPLLEWWLVAMTWRCYRVLQNSCNVHYIRPQSSVTSIYGKALSSELQYSVASILCTEHNTLAYVLFHSHPPSPHLLPPQPPLPSPLQPLPPISSSPHLPSSHLLTWTITSSPPLLSLPPITPSPPLLFPSFLPFSFLLLLLPGCPFPP